MKSLYTTKLAQEYAAWREKRVIELQQKYQMVDVYKWVTVEEFLLQVAGEPS